MENGYGGKWLYNAPIVVFPLAIFPGENWLWGKMALLHRYDGQIYFHWYKILGLLYKRALFDLQFVHNLFWLKLKWNTRSKLCVLYHLSFSMLWWSSRTLPKLKSQSQKRINERKYQYLKYKNKNHSGMDTQQLSDINLAPNLNLSFVQNMIEDLI